MTLLQKRNITISLNATILRQARVLAAKRSTSINRLLAEQLERLVNEEEMYESTHRVATDLMQTGLPLGGDPPMPRDALHAR